VSGPAAIVAGPVPIAGPIDVAGERLGARLDGAAIDRIVAVVPHE
jgi:hypothetical protein